MTARVIAFPNAPAEPPVDPRETLDCAARKHALGLLREAFGADYVSALEAVYEARTYEGVATAVALIEATP